ncbi:Uncharacterized protein GBIM_01107 [Gryllus bimaculatus]|nr:Uncharacterized protein GBIM_01107 [Gryllus bimaculatus]
MSAWRVAVPPLSVRLLGANRPLSARAAHEVQCQAVGGRPPPHISWRKAGLPLVSARHARCTECLYNAPEVTLDLGANLNASFIREGDDVYFECSVRAHPWIYKVIWKHQGRPQCKRGRHREQPDVGAAVFVLVSCASTMRLSRGVAQGRPLHSNASAGVILSNQTLVLQSVRNHSSGDYTCVASNAEGDGESEPFHLDVKYAPVCRPHQQRVYGAARLETLQGFRASGRQPPRALSVAYQSSAVAPPSDARGFGARARRSLAAIHARRRARSYGTSCWCWAATALGRQAGMP